jgi:hypothetical protein
VVAKVEWHASELFPRVGFIVTNIKWRSRRRAVLRRAGHGGAVDQGGQERGKMDEAVVSVIQG